MSPSINPDPCVFFGKKKRNRQYLPYFRLDPQTRWFPMAVFCPSAFGYFFFSL